MNARIDKSLISAALIDRLRAGDNDAFESIFMEYFERIKHFIYLLVKSRDVAEDLAQDIFVTLWENKEKIDPAKNFNAFMYTMTKNAVFNYIKSLNVRNKYSGSLSIQWHNIDHSSPESIIVAKETELLISLATSHMPKQRKRIFEMSRNERLRNEEIASKLNISRNAVEKQLRLAMSDIRNVVTLLAMFFAMGFYAF
ncbi:DNA-directed RNA polymerase sigma-70 factor [Bacteroidia bacterium]|nr:DNA-directed RNA polymerase sigma-70 factor [Bacteroidia bacterium]